MVVKGAVKSAGYRSTGKTGSIHYRIKVEGYFSPKKYQKTTILPVGGGFKDSLNVYPYFREMIQFDEQYFSDVLTTTKWS